MVRSSRACTQAFFAALAALMLCIGTGAAQAQSVQARVQPADMAKQATVQRHQALAPVPAVVDLGAWAAPKTAAARSDVVQIGARRAVTLTGTTQATGALLQWQASGDGGLVAAVSFVSDDAFGLRAGLQIGSLPGNATVRVYAPDDSDGAFEISGRGIAQILQNNNQAGEVPAAANTWWTPAVDGNELTVEIQLPAGAAASDVKVSIPSLVHIYENIFALIDDGTQFQAKLNNAASCTLDSTCYDAYARQRDAVARMLYVNADGAFLCTGTLLNDRTGSGTPYFMTANHCISSQAAASSLQTFWFYRTPSCNSRLLSSASKTLKGGARLLYTSATPDATLLVLNDTPPAGAVFAGWDANAVAKGAAVVGVHHPRGDLQKISFGNVVGSTDCKPGKGVFTCYASDAMGENYYRVQWSQGMTEGGSSGSALFVNGVLTGMLSNGSASCTNAGGFNNYARFDRVFPAIQQWLFAEVAAFAADSHGRSAVFRFYNAQTGAHFYTASVEQRDAVIAVFPAFQYEGVAFYAYSQQAGAGLVPVYRFYNQQNASHVYTVSTSERDAMRANPAVFSDEGVAWWAQAGESSATQAVFRFLNQQTGRYFYTASAQERDQVIATYPQFQYQGVAYSVWVAQ